MSSVRLSKLDDVRLTGYKDSFIIGEILTTKATILTGEPKAGKSLLAAGMVIALVNKEKEFLGLPILRGIDRVVWGWTDDGADEELRARLDGVVPHDSVRLLHIDDQQRDAAYWAEVSRTLDEWDADLFVLDHLLGALPPKADIASSPVASEIASNLRILGQYGTPILAITHTPKGNSEGITTASSVIGGRAAAAGARGVATLRMSKAEGRRIFTVMNRGREDLELRVNVRRSSPDSEVPVWTLDRMISTTEATKKKKRNRSAETGRKLAEIARLLVAEQPSTSSAAGIAREYAARVGIPQDTVKRRIKGFAHIDTQGRWVDGPKP